MPEVILNHNGESIRYPLDKDILNIGRSKDNDIVLENLSVSRNHARIRAEEGQYILIDLNSANGTLVNGKKVTKAAVHDGDIITVGKHEFRFVEDDIIEDQTANVSPSDSTGAIQNLENLQPALIVTKGRKSWVFNIEKQETSIGKGKTNDIALPDLFASKRHAVIIQQGNEFFIRDLGSWRGTILNDQPIKEEDGPQSLKENDVIQIGACQIQFTTDPESSAQAAEIQEVVMDSDQTPVMSFPKGEEQNVVRDGEEPSEGLVVFSDGDEEFKFDENEAQGTMDEEEQFVQDFADGVNRIYDESNQIKFPEDEVQKTDLTSESIDKFDELDEVDKTDAMQVLNQMADQPVDEQPVIEESAEAPIEIDVEELDDEDDFSELELPVESAQAEEIEIPDQVEEAAQEEESAEQQLDLDQLDAPAEEEQAEEQVESEPETEEKEEDQVEEVDLDEAVSEEPEKPAAKVEDLNLEDYDEKEQKEIKMWLKALENNSGAIRSEAKRRLKAITGNDYE